MRSELFTETWKHNKIETQFQSLEKHALVSNAQSLQWLFPWLTKYAENFPFKDQNRKIKFSNFGGYTVVIHPPKDEPDSGKVNKIYHLD